MQTLAADLGISEEVARAMNPTIPTIAPPLDATSSATVPLAIASTMAA